MTAEHWQARYKGLNEDKPSWFQAVPATSMQLITRFATPSDRIVDVGGGDSSLVDQLVDAGFTDVTVVDISGYALDTARTRLGSSAPVTYTASDVRDWRPEGRYIVWHDRAAYHFLVDPWDIRGYWAKVYDAIPIGGHVIMATFADDGPQTCSGLPVRRYDEDAMKQAMGVGLATLEQFREQHLTPWGSSQSFLWTVARRVQV